LRPYLESIRASDPERCQARHDNTTLISWDPFSAAIGDTGTGPKTGLSNINAVSFTP
jgi:hypothetical protein